MNSKIIPERDLEKPERRRDGPAETVDEAVVLASIDGVGPALDYMSTKGVPHQTALRVLAGPQYHRRPGTGTINSVTQLITSKLRARKN